MSPGLPDLSIVIPAWNERDNLEVVLPALKETLSFMSVNAEIVVVDGGSKDGTAEACAKRGVRLIQQRERGYGGALLEGLAAAQANLIVTMDADLSHRPSFLEEFWRRRNDAEMLIASRYIPGGKAEMGSFRRLLSLILNRTFALVLSIDIKDLSSGFRMYRREALSGLAFQSRDFDILEEILVQIHASGGRILEVPFHYMPRGAGRSHARLFKFGVAYLKLLLRMRRDVRKPVSRPVAL